MKKCDFCEMSSPSGDCYCIVPAMRREYCEKSIRCMTNASKGNQKRKKENGFGARGR